MLTWIIVIGCALALLAVLFPAQVFSLTGFLVFSAFLGLFILLVAGTRGSRRR